jgi:UDP-galactopyranose mutase
MNMSFNSINEVSRAVSKEVHSHFCLPSDREDSESRQYDLICFSHLRWDFVYQRPQHLLSRAAQNRRVFFIEEPIFDEGSMRYESYERDNGVVVVVPHLPQELKSVIAIKVALSGLVDQILLRNGIKEFLAWYYTPMALEFTEHLRPVVSVYDCMDELSAFKGASSEIGLRERNLFKEADLVFTGGQSLYEAKRNHHHSVFAFPSSIDRNHFAQARDSLQDPCDQSEISHPRLGFFGVIDERFDIDLLRSVSAARPDWQFVMVGPIVKIDPNELPRAKNIHYLGGKNYQELPGYIANWDVALLLFARNESTRFISPTKTPEYLAAGKHVVSTSIRDVVRPYGEEGLVSIADEPEQFVQAVEKILIGDQEKNEWLERVDAFLADMSWDNTWSQMDALISNKIQEKKALQEREDAAAPETVAVARAS